MAIRYYSDRLNRFFNSVEEANKAEFEAKEKENAIVILPEYFDKQFTYYLDENHDIFRTQSQPTNYYVFRDYLLNEGYYYDYNYKKANFEAHDKVVFPYHKAMPIKGLKEDLESRGFRLMREQDEQPYSVFYYSR